MIKAKRKNVSGVAVIGTGYWGQNLVRNYAELGVLKLICDKNESILRSLKSQTGGLQDESHKEKNCRLGSSSSISSHKRVF